MNWDQVLQLLGILMTLIVAAGGAVGITNALKQWLGVEGVAAQIVAFVVQGLVAVLGALLAGQITPDMDWLTILGIVITIILGANKIYAVQRRERLTKEGKEQVIA